MSLCVLGASVVKYLDKQLTTHESAVRLMVAIVSAIGAGGRNFASQLSHTQAPENIMREARNAKLRGRNSDIAKFILYSSESEYTPG